MYAPHPDDPQHPQHPHHHHYTQHAAAVAAHAHAQQQMASGSGARHSADLSPPSRSGSPDERGGGSGGVGPSVKPSGPPKGRKRREGINSEDWARVRKDNHKEVERRRRGTINQGINELGMIIPNSGGGERAKGAVLNRAVIYIRQLKENEARNIEKWTLEKLLMDQAMGDLQAQMEDMRRRWDDDRSRLGMLERELTDVRAQLAAAKAAATSESTAGATTSESAGNKRQRVD
ncbi:hypothetical protein BS47DRAFT_1318001 [Hydnum rufescens UP504]|uniref:BHLH domain-containing protein n=1 Tax=Hydnum rufescens UP504 TaxID=1448309 RepID=A0A9P6AW05_9AGAM|nr:hypothetical protein BS47DRAFT_1318001 [Hydnum rufescens UP504]